MHTCQYDISHDLLSTIFIPRYLLILFRDAPVEVWAMTKNPLMVPLPLPLFLLFGKTIVARLEIFIEITLLNYHIEFCMEQLVCASILQMDSKVSLTRNIGLVTGLQPFRRKPQL
jgi:hypothetical protein